MRTIVFSFCAFLIGAGLGLLIAALSQPWMDWVSYANAVAGTMANTAGWMIKGAMR